MTSRMTTLARALWHARWVIAIASTAALASVALTGPLRARASSPEPLLPNLVAEAPTSPAIAAEGSPKRLLLRFNGYVHNIGPGALDMKGSRSAPTLSPRGELELKHFELTHENLSPELERELATSPMQVSQRLFTTSSEETNIERAHVEDASSATMIYANADGHNHWHLQHVARYSLWNAAQSAEVAPSQKVGFCLEDSEHVDSFGPSAAVYEDQVRGEFCERYRPQATSLREGISRGWRDRYLSNLAFQWVDISNVQPGKYWLREDVNPDGVIEETGGPNAPAYSKAEVGIPGFVAEPQTVLTQASTAVAVTLRAAEYGSHGEAAYTVIAQPKHGKLTGIGAHLTYTPEVGYSGADEFNFTTRDEDSEFPLSPTVATVSIAVSEAPSPAITITSAPAGMTAGTSATLAAQSTNYKGGIQWSASAGYPIPSQGAKTTFTAPASRPPGGAVTVTARLAADPKVSASRTIAITPVPAPVPSQDLPVSLATGVASEKVATPTYLSRPRAMLLGTKLVISTIPGLAGVIGVSAYLGRQRLGHCAARTPADRRFICRIALHSAREARARLSVVATLRAGGRTYVSALPATVIPQMRMVPVGNLKGAAHAAARSSIYWCSPSTLTETLGGTEE